MSFEKRDQTVQEFYKEDGPRVLIFSSVGSAGLNLSIADIVIYLASWSLSCSMSAENSLHSRANHGAPRMSSKLGGVPTASPRS